MLLNTKFTAVLCDGHLEIKRGRRITLMECVSRIKNGNTVFFHSKRGDKYEDLEKYSWSYWDKELPEIYNLLKMGFTVIFLSATNYAKLYHRYVKEET